MDITNIQVGTFLGKLVAHKGWRFQLGDEEVTGDQMGDASCILPMVLWNAESLYRKAFGKEMGLRLEASEDAFLGVKVAQVCRPEVPISVLVLMSQHAVREMVLHSHPEIENTDSLEQDSDAVPPVQIEDFVNEFLVNVSGPEFNIALPERVRQLVSRAQPAAAAAAA